MSYVITCANITGALFPLRPGGIVRVASTEDLKPLQLAAPAPKPCVSCGAPFDGRYRCSYCTTLRSIT